MCVRNHSVLRELLEVYRFAIDQSSAHIAACLGGHLEVLEYLMDNFPMNKRDNTILYLIAATTPNATSLEFLLDRNIAEVDVEVGVLGILGGTRECRALTLATHVPVTVHAMHLACIRKDLDAVKWLREEMKCPWDARHLQLALGGFENERLVQYMIDSCCPIPLWHVDALTNYNWNVRKVKVNVNVNVRQEWDHDEIHFTLD